MVDGKGEEAGRRLVEQVSAQRATTPLDVEELVDGARRGERGAWNGLVRRFQPLIRATARRHRLNDGEVDDVGQAVWLRLVEHLERIREPRALPKWIVTTARRESLRLARSAAGTFPVGHFGAEMWTIPADVDDVDSDLLRVEATRAVRDGLAELRPEHRELLLLLVADRAPNYREISRLLNMPMGSIGPSRARCLARLRATSALQAYLSISPPVTAAPG